MTALIILGIYAFLTFVGLRWHQTRQNPPAQPADRQGVVVPFRRVRGGKIIHFGGKL